MKSQEIEGIEIVVDVDESEMEEVTPVTESTSDKVNRLSDEYGYSPKVISEVAKKNIPQGKTFYEGLERLEQSLKAQ